MSLGIRGSFAIGWGYTEVTGGRDDESGNGGV